MFSHPVYNFSSQHNENFLSQNLAGLSLTSAPPSYHQQQNINFGTSQFPQQQRPIDIGGYVPPSLDDTNTKWPSPDDVNVLYQRGSTVVRQHNNSTIDDYYKKFLRPITDYVAIPTTGQPTYVYQNLGPTVNTTTTGLTPQVVVGVEPAKEINPVAVVTSHSKEDRSEEKRHKKKHKKRSSKHAHSEDSKNNDEEKAIEEVKSTDTDSQQTSSVSSSQQIAGSSVLNQTGASGPQVPLKLESNPVVCFDIEIDHQERGRLVMELFRHVLPRTTQNFLSLALNEHGFGYRLSYFHRIIPGFMAQGGDFEKSDGTGGYSIYGAKFDDEGFPFSHDRAGLLSMANSGPDTNGSQFFITLEACTHLDNKHVVFGQVLQGFHLLKDFDMSGSDNGEPLREIKIANTNQLQ